MIVVFTLMWITHGTITRTEHVAPDWDTCVGWRRGIRFSQTPEPGVALITGCQWRIGGD